MGQAVRGNLIGLFVHPRLLQATAAFTLPRTSTFTMAVWKPPDLTVESSQHQWQIGPSLQGQILGKPVLPAVFQEQKTQFDRSHLLGITYPEEPAGSHGTLQPRSLPAKSFPLRPIGVPFLG